MKLRNLWILAVVIILSYSCKKDLGNYTYSPPSEPVINGIKDVSFPALIGDSLIIKPEVSLAGADPLKDLDFEWRILLMEKLKDTVLTGYPLKMMFNLGTGERASKLVVTDKRNGLKYTYAFKVNGVTQFSLGQVVLSSDNGLAKLSFIKPDDTVLPDLYQSLNGQSLPEKPIQLYYSKPLPYQLLTKEEFWVLCDDPSKGSVILDASSMLRKDNFASQFFLPPTSIQPGHLETLMGTISNGVINNKLYIGISSTAPFAPDYGKFANEQTGDYLLSKYFTHGSSFYFGFDNKATAFVVFTGDGSYLGTNYTSESTTAFNPKNIAMKNLIYMKTGESGTSYAFFKEPDGNIYELKFEYNLSSTDKKINPSHKRVFKGSSLIRDDSKWIKNSLNVFYFSSDDKIYRYNPINESLVALEANLAGKKVSMIKISDDDNTLTVGVDGAVHSLNVSVGANGNIIKTISGIPGAPVDILNRK